MRPDYDKIRDDFRSINPTLKDIANKLESNLLEIFSEVERVDRVACRVKAEESFLNKTLKKNRDDSLKYRVPIKEIQDFIGARIIVYYKTDLQRITEIVNQ